MNSPNLRPARSIGRQSGAVLIEAMIGFLIFAVGVLGLVGIQASMSRAQNGAKIRADAVQLANEAVGLMWADSQPNHSKYTSAGCAGHPPCQAWLAKVQRTLPAGEGQVQFEAANLGEVRVLVKWTLPDEGPHRYEMIGVVMP